MYALPAGMAERLNTSHEVGAYLQIWQRWWPPQTNLGESGSIGYPLPIPPILIEDGTLTIDGTGAERRRCTLTIGTETIGPVLGNQWGIPSGGAGLGPAGVIPVNVTSVLTPFRNYFQLFYTVGSDIEPFLVGMFTITNSVVNCNSSGQINVTIEAKDFSQEVSKHQLVSTYTIPPGQDIRIAIQDLLYFAAPNEIMWFTAGTIGEYGPGGAGTVVAYAPGANGTTQATFDAGQDPWDACQQMADQIGMQLYFQPTGACTLQPLLDPALQSPVWSYTDGVMGSQAIGLAGLGNCGITQISHKFSQENMTNDSVVVSESTNSALSGSTVIADTTSFLAQTNDLEVASPTNVNGFYGTVSQVLYDQTTVQQEVAAVASRAYFWRSIGLREQLMFSALPNPAHEAFDVIAVQCNAIGLTPAYAPINETGTPTQAFVITQLTLPLTSKQPMQITAICVHE
jgi:hypothetical protein